MADQNNQSNKRLYYLLLGIGALVLLRFLFRMPGLLILVLWLVVIGLGAYLLYHFWQKRNAEKRYQSSIEGKITAQIDYCKSQLTLNQKDIKTIENNISELKKRLQSNAEIPATTRQQTEQLIKGFEQQKDLRQTKIDFFQSAIKKLNILLHNHELQQELGLKEKELNKLKEDNYDSLSDLEEVKSNLEFNQEYIETIDKLSLRMLETNDLDGAETLNLELKKMTKALKKS